MRRLCLLEIQWENKYEIYFNVDFIFLKGLKNYKKKESSSACVSTHTHTCKHSYPDSIHNSEDSINI